jgi:hypothetical protein
MSNNKNCKEMRKVGKFDDALRMKIIEEHLAGSSKYSLVKKYKIGYPSTITDWMHTFGITEAEKQAVPEAFMKKRKQDEHKSAEVIALEKENKALKLSLARSEMKAEAYDTMIGLAESTYQIEIRKNSDTKQS